MISIQKVAPRVCFLLRSFVYRSNVIASAFGHIATTATTHHPRHHSGGPLPLSDKNALKPAVVEEDQVWEALVRLEELDSSLGVGSGATKERAILQAIIDEWEAQGAADMEDDYEDNDENSEIEIGFCDGVSPKCVVKHGPEARVAILGGDPSRRRQMIEKKLAPFGSLDQFGSQKDVGPSDTTKLLRRIASQQYDVVYVWTRFNAHTSRLQVKKACLETGTTRFEEVESLAHIL